MGLPSYTGLTALGRLDSALHTFAAALQGVLASGVGMSVPSPSLSAPTIKVTTLSLLHLRFSYRVAVDGTSLPFGSRLLTGKVG